MRRVVFVLGCSGVGKSTLVRHLLGKERSSVGRWTVGEKFAALGPYDGDPFDGPDRLPFSPTVIRKTLERLETGIPEHLIALLDGARLSVEDVTWARERARCVALLLTASRATILARRARRGVAAAPGWLEKSEARAVRTAAAVGLVHRIDTELPPARVLSAVRLAIGGAQ